MDTIANAPEQTPIFNMDSPETRRFLNMMKTVRENPLKISDFLDDTIPQMAPTEKDKEELDAQPKGIHTDEEMEGAWKFLNIIMYRSGFGAMTPAEIIELYRSVSDGGIKVREINHIRRLIKNCKHDLNKKTYAVSKEETMAELERLEEKKVALEKEAAQTASFSKSRRSALVQAVLIIGFIKEYVCLRAVKVENAEYGQIFVPITDDQKITINEEQKMIYIKEGAYTFYANPIKAVEQNKEATKFVPIIKQYFNRDIRVGEDRLDYVSILIPNDSVKSLGYDEVVDMNTMTQMIETAKASPLLTKEDLEKADAVEGIEA